ncbi:hypothetical protein EK21DRAFT_112840 [Setomelanomma holmii]|uniref:Uncharacterized protein n=1 Tax=Setomelanomma holmii TaxID=210430 RepID=A0A9P4HAA2_9PLEO|nr:hypothetical protein EK21DRAFT_112840 [Setomelanomma holmii]
MADSTVHENHLGIKAIEDPESIEAGANEDSTGLRRRKPRPRRVSRPYRVHSKNDLLPYTKFLNIYLERKYQRLCTLLFLALPDELRKVVYKYLLVSRQPIKMWEETGKVYQNQNWRRQYTDIMSREICTGRKRCNLGLLRTGKLINAKAAEILYGQNEFRFSGKNRLMAAFAYVTKIGPGNLDYMTSLTVGMPFRSSNERHVWRESQSLHLDAHPRSVRSCSVFVLGKAMALPQAVQELDLRRLVVRARLEVDHGIPPAASELRSSEELGVLF